MFSPIHPYYNTVGVAKNKNFVTLSAKLSGEENAEKTILFVANYNFSNKSNTK
jgi:hypothetical protein